MPEWVWRGALRKREAIAISVRVLIPFDIERRRRKTEQVCVKMFVQSKAFWARYDPLI